MQRMGLPEEVGPSYVFLASDDSSYFSGQVLHPNGECSYNTLCSLLGPSLSLFGGVRTIHAWACV